MTSFGLELIERAESLGMVIDISHLNDEGFWDVMDVTQNPVIATHANCRVLASSRRNLTDDQIKALAATGGIIGVNTIDVFIDDNPEKSTIAKLIDHVDHIAALVGIEHVGIGLDLCDHVKDYHHTPNPFVTRDLIKSHGQLTDITAGLIDRGYADKDIIAILGGNFQRLFSQVLIKP